MPTRIVNPSGITAELVRHFIYDRSLEDNPIKMDLEWSDDEISKAMYFCALSYNAIPPYINSVVPTALPADILFYYGIVYHLYLSRIAQLTRRDLDYTAGNMTVDLVKRQLAHLEKWSAYYRGEFQTLTQAKKTLENLESCYRCY